MKSLKYLTVVLLAFLVPVILLTMSNCRPARLPVVQHADTLVLNPGATGDRIQFSFKKGPEHNHPLMAIWIEDTTGKYIQTLYVAESVANGFFRHGDKSTGKWMPGPIRRPAALPVWSFSRGVKEIDGLYVPSQETAIPDAYTGATPAADFLLEARTDNLLPQKFIVFFEINQSWDWNEYWTNNKFPDDQEYKTSCQPALVYKAFVNKADTGKVIMLELAGRSHHSGKDGKIYDDLNTITTAKKITASVWVRLED